MTPYFYTLGLDLGQRSDYSGLSIIEEQHWDGEWVSPATRRPEHVMRQYQREARPWPEKPPLHLRHLYRFPLGTPYPRIVREVAALIADPTIRAYGYALVVDATGVGRPVLDLFREAHLAPIGVTITGGNTAIRDKRSGEWSVPKRDLVSAVQSALQTERLQIAASLPEAATLTRELSGFRVTINLRTAHDSYGAWREGIHDDLVLSVALATWFRDRYFRASDMQRMNRTMVGEYA